MSKEQNGQTQLIRVAEYSGVPNAFCFTKAGFEQQIAEAEARGAREQRRKDAEGQEPVAWVRRSEWDDNWPMRAGIWRSCQLREFTIPLFDRPANVAALEGRIAELEGALKKIIDTAGADCIHGLGPYIKIAQAALKYEGGVWCAVSTN